MKIVTTAIKRQYDYSIIMLREIIDACPSKLWTEANGSFPFWQQIYHALYWTDYNIQESHGGEKIFSRKNEKKINHELNKEATDSSEYLTKDEMNHYIQAIIEKKNRFFNNLTDKILLEPIPHRRDGITYFDIITNQIRHIMYHVGHCDCILRNNGHSVKAWLSIYGEYERQ